MEFAGSGLLDRLVMAGGKQCVRRISGGETGVVVVEGVVEGEIR